MKYKIHTMETVEDRETTGDIKLSELLIGLCREYGYGYDHDRQYLDVSLDPDNININGDQLLLAGHNYDIHLSSEDEVDIESLIAELEVVDPTWYITGVSITVKDNTIEELTVNYQHYCKITEHIGNLVIP